MILRARQWLKEVKYPIEICAYKNAFKLEFKGPCWLLLKQKFETDGSDKIVLPNQLSEKKEFTSEEWASEKNISVRTALREITSFVKKDLLTPVRRGRMIKYKWKNK